VRRAVALIGATLLGTIGLAACGGSSAGLIPTSNATTLGDDLNALALGLSNHNCASTDAALDRVNQDIFNLPSSVERKLRDNLLAGYGNLDTTARTQCRATSTHTPTHPKPGSTGASHSTGVTTSPTGVTTTPSGVTTSPSGVTTSPSGVTTGLSGSTVGPGGGAQAPTGSSGTTDNGLGGGAASA
jgi:hypothetical protein